METEATSGEKMIEVCVRFWTDSLASDGKIKPKHGWTSGIVRLTTNESHGIRAKDETATFNTMAEIVPAIEKMLIKHGVILHLSRKERKYVAPVEG